MKIATANKQGQIVIPIELRKKFNITEKTYLKIFYQDDQICIKPLEEETSKEKGKIVLDFSKKEKQDDFHFNSTTPAENNLAEKVDDILY